MRKIRFISSLVLITTISSQLFSCGYLLYPERRGQNPTSKVDWAIAGLDAIGLLFFIIPGVIAFGIDLGTGTIYLPKNTHDVFSSNHISSLDWQDAKKIKIDPKNINNQTIANAIKEASGLAIDLSDPHLKIYQDNVVKKELVNS